MGMTFEAFKAKNKFSGNHWFSPDTMKWWRSRIAYFDCITGYFISSEKRGFDDLRRAFTVRKADFETGKVETVSKFQEFKSKQGAMTYIKKLRGVN